MSGAVLLGEPRVCVCWVQDTRWSASFGTSLLQLALADRGRRVPLDGWCGLRYSTGGIVEARNRAVELALRPGFTHLLWVDTDIAFHSDALERLLEVGGDVVAGLCFVEQRMQPDGQGGWVSLLAPAMYDLADPGPYTPHWEYPRGAVVDVDAVGAGFTLVSRTVLEGVGERPYGRFETEDGGGLGEDISFCERAKVAGYSVQCHTAVRCTHHKDVWLSEDHYLAMRGA